MSTKLVLATNLPEFANEILDEARFFFDGLEAVVNAHPQSKCVGEEGAMRLEVVLDDDGSLWKTQVLLLSEECYPISRYEYIHEASGDDALSIKRNKKRCVKIAAFRALKQAYPYIHTPWGSLTGIRPTSLLRELQRDLGNARAKRVMLEEFDVTQKKYELAETILTVQSPRTSTVSSRDLDIYVGIPYCKTRCLYCSFLSDVRTKKTDMEAYINALKKDISIGARIAIENNFKIGCIYIGGGTPTVLTDYELEQVTEHLLDAYGVRFGEVEFTVEAGRPDTIDKSKLKALRRAGVGRISINPQTMNEKTLSLIGRNHSSVDVERAYDMAKEEGFDVNMDIIACLPGENETDVRFTLDRITKMHPENITVHTLAIKRSSKLKQTLGEYEIPDANTADSMVEFAQGAAMSIGMRPYYMYRQKYMSGNLENVGYALPGKECLYNVDMMEEIVSIMAHGAGAMSKRVYPERSVRVERVPNPKDVETYINKLDAIAEEKADMFRQEF